MAGEIWTKMRDCLCEHPKVIAMVRVLTENRGFREWLTPGGSSPVNGQIVSDEALRCVVVTLLLRVWSRARAHGEYAGNHLVLSANCIADLDQLSGVPGFGKAMVRVGWATAECGVTLPNFKGYNPPLSASEKQKRYRDRKARRVTEALPCVGNDAVTPSLSISPSQGGDLKNEAGKKTGGAKRASLRAAFVKPSVSEVADYCRERGNAVDAARFVDYYESNGWRVGKNPMKDWKAAVRGTWEKNRFENRPTKPTVGLYDSIGEFLKGKDRDEG